MADKTIYQIFGMPPHHLNIERGFVAGVECEVEGVRNIIEHEMFSVTNDNSLRGKGALEIISVPLATDALLDAFKDLHSKLAFYPDTEPFSIRTSTHVHVNCRNLTVKQARVLVLLYALFEECFFLQVKPDRRHNIHCVPLTETHLPSIYKSDIASYESKWSKYTALNLKRLSDLGTMEFRHLHGTNNVEEFSQWIKILENTWKLAQQVDFNAKSLTKENILKWFDLIFFVSPRVYSIRPTLFEVIRNSIVDVKFATV